MTNPGHRWAVVGGGFLGMELARQLRVAGKTVTLIEAAPHLGGMADAWKLGDLAWDRHYHVILMSDARTLQLVQMLKLETALEWVETKTGFYTDGKLYSMSNTWEFLRFPPLWFIDKLRLGGTIFYASKIKNWKTLERVPVADWLRKWSGRRTTGKIWLPLLRAKLGENYKFASAAFIWAIIARMYAARRTGLKKEMFGYVRGGYRVINDALTMHLRADGVRLKLGLPVRGVAAANSEMAVNFADGTAEPFDNVVVTTAAPLAAKLCPDLAADEIARLNAIRYQGIVCVSLVLKKPLADFYVTNITDAGIPFTAVIELTALVKPSEFKGRHLIYLPKYVAPDDPLFEHTDGDIRTTFVAALLKMYPDLAPADVLACGISRVRNVLAISTLNYSEIVPPMATSVPGLHIVNTSQIVNGTLNVNETLTLADRAAAVLLSDEPT